LIGPVYQEKKRKEELKQSYFLTLFIVSLVFILAAIALTLLAI